MNNHNKRAGESTRKMADKRYKARVWFILIMLAALLLILVLVLESKAWGIGGFGILGLAVLFRLVMKYANAQSKRMTKEGYRAARGARAEEKIGTILDSLGDDYFVLHDITSPYGNIDHVVISRQGGVFLIETKAHGGKVFVANGRLLVNGHEPEKDFITQALRNTYWLRDTIRSGINIEPWITPVIVFTNAFVEYTPSIRGVKIINKKYLLTALRESNVQASNLAAWENRGKIREICLAPRGISR